VPVVSHAPFESAKAMAAGYASEWIEINRAEKVIPNTTAADSVDLTACTAGAG